MLKSRRMRWEGHASHMERIEMYTDIWWESQKERDL
jgi:hypothetical protein